jgi:parallel beta-helix repeat protein
MPHCFKLARRLSCHRSTWGSGDHPHLRRGFIRGLASMAGCLVLLAAVACTEDDPFAPATAGPGATFDSTAQTEGDSAIVVVNDSMIDGVDPVLAAATTGTTIYPGQSIQAKVNSFPGGTAFTLKAGVHRLQMVNPKSGSSFVGEPGAILNGARLLTTFTKQGNYWVSTGQTQQGERRGDGRCLPDSPRCAYPEQLFINDKLLKHVASLAAVGAGKWYFDYGSDKIYFYDDPRGKKVETSVTKYAFSSNARGVTVRGLIVEKYASPAQSGAIGGGGGTSGWIVRDNEVRWNHGSGIRTGSGMQVLNNNAHHQGQMGIGGSGSNVLVQDNEIAYNNVAGFGTGWEAGATKFSHTDGLVVRGNFSHHNHGAGLWTDVNNINTLYEGNRVEDNDWRGIYHEISYKVVIRNNIIRRNGFNLPLARAFPVDGAGILIHDSQNAEIYGNTVEGNKNGIGAIESNRGSGKYGAYDIVNLNVHDNRVVQPSGRAAGITQHVGSNAVFTSKNNRFTRNSYDIGSSGRYFRWMNGDRSTPEWKGYGMDMTGTFN